MAIHLVRHANAGNRPQWDGDDEDRPLTDLGRQQARALGEAFHRHGITVDAVFTSPYARAWQTAAEFREAVQADEKEPEPCPLLAPEVGKRRKLAKFVAAVGVENVAIVGHDPDLSVFLAWLIGCEPENVCLEKGGAACVRFEGGPQKHGGQLAWVLTPDWYMVGATAGV